MSITSTELMDNIQHSTFNVQLPRVSASCIPRMSKIEGWVFDVFDVRRKVHFATHERHT
jgi:hypothetical protein